MQISLVHSVSALLFASQIDLTKSVIIEEVVSVGTEIEDLMELGELMDTVASKQMYARVHSLGLTYSQVMDTIDTLNALLPKTPTAQLPTVSALNAMKKVEERIGDVVTQGRRVAGGRHKGFGTAFAASSWAQTTKKAFATLLDNRHPLSYAAAVAPLKFQAATVDAKLKMMNIDRIANGLKCEPCDMRRPAHLRGEVTMKEVCCEVNESRMRDLFVLLHAKVDEWEAIAEKLVASVDHVVIAIGAMYPQKPQMGNGADMKREPRNEEVAAAVSDIHSFPFMLSMVSLQEFKVDVGKFLAWKNLTLSRLASPMLAVTEGSALSRAEALSKLAERFDGVAKLQQILELTHHNPQAILEKVEVVMMKGSGHSKSKLNKMRHVEVDDLIEEMDRFLYTFDMEMPGNSEHKALTAWTALAKEGKFWETAFLTDLSVSPQELNFVKDLFNEYRKQVDGYMSIMSTNIVPRILEARNALLNLTYRF